MPNWVKMTVEQANDMYGKLGYEVLEDINHGTFKQVFRANHRGQSVALKIIQLQGFDRRTEREIRLMHSINSPYIAKILDFNLGSLEYNAYVVEEFISGLSLHETITKRKLTIGESFKIFDELFQALLACAEKKIVHRDVKPQNVLLRDTGAVVLTDFGLARPLDESTITASGITIGTVAYAPPEFIRYNSEHISETSDLFSLGVMFYWLLTDKHPFITTDTKPYDIQMLEHEAKPPHEFVLDFNISLSKFIMKLIRRDPAKRYASTSFAYEKFQQIKREFIG